MCLFENFLPANWKLFVFYIVVVAAAQLIAWRPRLDPAGKPVFVSKKQKQFAIRWSFLVAFIGICGSWAIAHLNPGITDIFYSALGIFFTVVLMEGIVPSLGVIKLLKELLHGNA